MARQRRATRSSCALIDEAAARPGPAPRPARDPERGVARPLRRGRQSVPVVHAAPAVHAALRADDRPAADRRVAERLPRRQRDPRPGRASRRPATAAVPVVLLQDYHLYLAATSIREARPDSLLLHFNHIPWPAVDSWLVLPAGPSAGDLRGAAGERHRRPADRSLRDQLPGLGRGLRARCAGRPGRPPRALARPDDLGARLSDLDRSRGAVPLRPRPGRDQAPRRADQAARARRAAAA